MSDFIALIAFSLLLLIGHLALSSIPVRDRLVGLLGEKVFIPLYATLSTVALVGAIHEYAAAPVIWLWQGPPGLAWVPVLAMPFALWLLIEGLTRSNPAAVYRAERPVTIRPTGLFIITRHPGMWGFALWAGAHLVVNGDAASVILMGSILVLALAGSWHIDTRRRRKLGESWNDYANHTSWLPFAALCAGRTTLSGRDLLSWRPALALVLYGGILHIHPWLFGVSPLPQP